MADQVEIRSFTGNVEVHELQEGKRTLEGYAAVFNTLSADIGGIKERILPGAFDEVLDNDVRAVFNHDANIVLGRSTAGTLKLEVDATGLRYVIDVPNSPNGNNVLEAVRRGDVSQSSFKFRLLSRDYYLSQDEDGTLVRTIKRVSRLMDVGPVTFPAYKEAEVTARSAEDWKKEHDYTPDHTRRLQLMRAQLNNT